LKATSLPISFRKKDRRTGEQRPQQHNNQYFFHSRVRLFVSNRRDMAM
jgi:hypothetical protein